MKVAFIGSKELGFACFKKIATICPEKIDICFTVKDDDDPRSKLSGFIEVCKQKNIGLKTLKRGVDLAKELDSTKASMGFMVGWYWMVSDKVLNYFPEGILGVHNSLLPKLRGGAPFVWAILNQHKQTGITIFTLTSEMDKGKIWGQRKFNIEKGDTIKTLFVKAELALIEWIKDNFSKLIAGKISPTEQSEENASYGGLRVPKDGWVKWTWTDDYIYDFVRAQTKPYPGAFTTFEGHTLRIWKVETNDFPYYGVPGQVIFMNKEFGVIAGNNKLLTIKKFDFEGSNGDIPIKFRGIGLRLPS